MHPPAGITIQPVSAPRHFLAKHPASRPDEEDLFLDCFSGTTYTPRQCLSFLGVLHCLLTAKAPTAMRYSRRIAHCRIVGIQQLSPEDITLLCPASFAATCTRMLSNLIVAQPEDSSDADDILPQLEVLQTDDKLQLYARWPAPLLYVRHTHTLSHRASACLRLSMYEDVIRISETPRSADDRHSSAAWAYLYCAATSRLVLAASTPPTSTKPQ